MFNIEFPLNQIVPETMSEYFPCVLEEEKWFWSIGVLKRDREK